MRTLLGRLERHAYAVMRIVAGFLFLFHGLQKLFGLFGGTVVEYVSLRGLAGVLELGGGLLLMLGWGTSAVAFVLSGEMAVAYFMSHRPRGAWPIQNGGELALLYSVVFLFMATRGSGAWGIDRSGRR